MGTETITLTLTRAEAEMVLEALDSHLYWQVNEDETRRDSGYIQEPYTADEQAVLDLEEKLRRQVDAA